MIKTISLGKQSFEIAIALRDSILLSTILTNVEIWHNVTQSDVAELEKVDKSLFQRLLCVPQSTPGIAFYLELGILPVSHS